MSDSARVTSSREENAEKVIRVRLLEADGASGKQYEYSRDLYDHLSNSRVPEDSVIVEPWAIGGGGPGVAYCLSPELIKFAAPVVSALALAVPAAAYIGKKMIDV